MMLKLRYIYIYAALTCFVLSAQAQIAALRGDEEYDRLLAQMGEISAQEGKLEGDRKTTVELFKLGGDSVAIYRQRIVEMEQTIFDLRARKSTLKSKISTIEQRWMLENLDSHATVVAPPIQSEEDRAASISQSNYAQNTLSPSEVETLREGEAQDRKLELKVNGYISNYRELARLSSEHAQCSTPQEADLIVRKYSRLDSLNRTIAKSCVERWGAIADNKNFIYSLLVERLGATDIFDKEQRLKIKSAELVDSLTSGSQSAELLSYYAGRLAMSEYELLIARKLRLPIAVDSLKYVRDSMRMAGFNYAPTKIVERLFIDYEPIKFSAKAIYTGANPIPAAKIYDKGVIYRLHVGSFKTRQAASLFRGAYPIGIVVDGNGLLGYYLGGYESLAEAEEAREVLLKKGFRRPEVVEWRDGESWNLTRKPRVESVKYRVEIVGVAELSADLKSVIETQGRGRELTKVDAQTFVVGLFDERSNAENLLESIRIMDSSVRVSIAEVK